jgi:hypothetical protein
MTTLVAMTGPALIRRRTAFIAGATWTKAGGSNASVRLWIAMSLRSLQ